MIGVVPEEEREATTDDAAVSAGTSESEETSQMDSFSDSSTEPGDTVQPSSHSEQKLDIHTQQEQNQTKSIDEMLRECLDDSFFDPFG